MSISKVEGVLQEGLDSPGYPGRRTVQVFDQFIGSPQQMGEALLMTGVGESVVGCPTIVHEAPVVIHSQYFGEHVRSTTRTNDIQGEQVGDEVPQPVQSTAHFPPPFFLI